MSFTNIQSFIEKYSDENASKLIKLESDLQITDSEYAKIEKYMEEHEI